MDERVRARLEGLIARLTDDSESRSALRALFEGAHESVAGYVEARLSATLPVEWRWLCLFVDHAAVGERWQELGEIVVIDDPGDEGDDPGVFIFAGKGHCRRRESDPPRPVERIHFHAHAGAADGATTPRSRPGDRGGFITDHGG